VKVSKGEKTFNAINTILLWIASLTIIFPLICVFNNSVRNVNDIMKHNFKLIPESFSLESYHFLISSSDRIINGYRASIFITVVGTLLCLIVTCMMAYSLSRKVLPGKNFFLIIVVITMFFSGGLIPSYLLVTGLGMRDSWWALIIPSLINPWNLLILRNFFKQIPESLEEAARMEGAGETSILIKIVLPLSLPSIASIGLFYAVSFWNAWFGASIYLETRSKYPLQLVLRQITQSINLDELAKRGLDMSKLPISEANVKAAAIVLTIFPILCVYPFIQKYFVKGVFMGSIKG
jgi:putative aldouronate transport system permease protein